MAASSTGSRGSQGSVSSEARFSAGLRYRNWRLQCDCEMKARIFRTTKAGRNYNRRFYGCENWKEDDSSRPKCDFFQWFDPFCQNPDILQQEYDALEQDFNRMERAYLALTEEVVAIKQERSEMEEVQEAMKKELEKLSQQNADLNGRVSLLMKMLCFMVFVLVVLVPALSS